MLAENTAVVAVPNEFTRNQLEGRLRTRIEDTLSERLGKPVRLAVSVDETLEPGEHDPQAPPAHTAPQAAVADEARTEQRHFDHAEASPGDPPAVDARGVSWTQPLLDKSSR